MKIYFAAPFAFGPYVANVHERAVELGHEPTSRWVDYATGSPDGLHRMMWSERSRLIAENDSDIGRADILVAFVIAGHGKEMFCEAALARSLGKPVYWVGHESVMPLSAFRVGASVLADQSALYEVLRLTAGPDGLDRVRLSMRQV